MTNNTVSETTTVRTIKSNQTDYFIVRLKVDQRAGNLVCRTWE